MKYVDQILELFKEKKFQVTRSRTYRPSTSGVKTYSHSKAVRASFSVVWKNAREKAPYIAGKCLVKPAAVKIARIMCGDAVAQKCANEQHCRANAYNQIGPRATAVSVKLCRLDKSLTAHWRSAIPVFSVCLFD